MIGFVFGAEHNSIEWSQSYSECFRITPTRRTAAKLGTRISTLVSTSRAFDTRRDHPTLSHSSWVPYTWHFTRSQSFFSTTWCSYSSCQSVMAEMIFICLNNYFTGGGSWSVYWRMSQQAFGHSCQTKTCGFWTAASTKYWSTNHIWSEYQCTDSSLTWLPTVGFNARGVIGVRKVTDRSLTDVLVTGSEIRKLCNGSALMSDWIDDWSPNTCHSPSGRRGFRTLCQPFLWYSSFPEGEALGTSQSSQSPYTCRSFASTKFVNVSPCMFCILPICFTTYRTQFSQKWSHGLCCRPMLQTSHECHKLPHVKQVQFKSPRLQLWN